MPQPTSHYFHVEIEVSGLQRKLAGNKLRVSMPVWTPGSYLIREFSRNVLDFKALSLSSNKEIRSEKISKDTWEIETTNEDEVSIKYRVYAFEFTTQTSYLDQDHGLINGASIFMYVRGYEQEPYVLTVKPWQNWRTVTCSLELLSQSGNAISFHVPNFDILVDSPIEVGNQEIREFQVSGINHIVSIYSAEKFDKERLVKDIQKIVEDTYQIFRVFPYSRYSFIIDISASEGYAGLEHLASTHCIAPYYRMIPNQEYRQLLSLFSHEFFHAWNVKRLRPRGLGPFDYSKEAYTKSLWISEGITSYYDDLILRRSSLLSVPEYLDAFVLNVDLMASLPGSKWESAEESSFDTWIRHYRGNENTPNVHSSYYTQGAVIGWLIDLEIMKNTEGKKSLDDVLRKLYDETVTLENRGFTDAEFEAACNKVSGTSLSEEIFERRVRGKDAIDYQNYFGLVGLKLEPKSERDSSKGYLGLKMRNEVGRTIVSNVLMDTPAEAAGIAAGDELIALDGLRIDGSKLTFLVANKKVGEEIDMLLSRDGRLLKVHAVVSKHPVFERRIFKMRSADESQKRMYKNWLRVTWDEDWKYEEYIQSPLKKQNFDYI